MRASNIVGGDHPGKTRISSMGATKGMAGSHLAGDRWPLPCREPAAPGTDRLSRTIRSALQQGPGAAWLVQSCRRGAAIAGTHHRKVPAHAAWAQATPPRPDGVPPAVSSGGPAPTVRHFVHDEAVMGRIIYNALWIDVGSWNMRVKIGTVQHSWIRWGRWLPSGLLLAPTAISLAPKHNNGRPPQRRILIDA